MREGAEEGHRVAGQEQQQQQRQRRDRRRLGGDGSDRRGGKDKAGLVRMGMIRSGSRGCRVARGSGDWVRSSRDPVTKGVSGLAMGSEGQGVYKLAGPSSDGRPGVAGGQTWAWWKRMWNVRRAWRARVSPGKQSSHVRDGGAGQGRVWPLAVSLVWQSSRWAKFGCGMAASTGTVVRGTPAVLSAAAWLGREVYYIASAAPGGDWHAWARATSI